ncbi:enoyl-CoA hydratase/carnithine racemase [Candidatus Scalindua japonica]|uniref:Enoyl-CoA hydratase/carnithine racemase n=1 Tax=Candidatus Scalindua japonica TaxID=1284222 RepID=A0A286TWJ5_9BACT|nr:polyketide synthase [Candidatus Scalindua japonica]GAX60244.1 enoyl-CoA hydratase/carnithine racemase [Candidatus Scalindua japonica]
MGEQIILAHKVVRYREVEDGIVIIEMLDKEHRNMFSENLIKGLISCFSRVRDNSNIKVVLLTGYDNYFCSGGTKEELLKIYTGELNFNDLDFFHLALDCDVPVVSAMQGHGIGGGLVFGMYADIIVMGRESVYSANFMKYGFTPGLGATLILPERLGTSLAHEMMLSAKNYQGGELEQRGIPFKVVPRKEVFTIAMQMSKELADKPRTSLIAMKKHLTQHLRARLPETIREELKMHELTFHQPEVKSRIEELFG